MRVYCVSIRNFRWKILPSCTKAKRKDYRIAAKRDFIADVKKHVTDISKKYILPEEGTMDFALMYIPSESVYYEIANLNELMDFARENRVYPVSPNTLYAHLQVLLLSFQGKELEQKSREVFPASSCNPKRLRKSRGKPRRSWVNISPMHITA